MKNKNCQEKKDNVEILSGSVYEQLKFKNHKEMVTKANLVIEISRAIKQQRLTQTRAADIIGITQPKLSELLRGRLRGYSVERLLYFLTELGKDIDIIVKTKSKNGHGKLCVYHENENNIIPMAAKGF